MSNIVSYVPLYFKSEYSMLHSACKLSPSISLAKEYGFKSIAITDLNVMHGALKFYKECKKNDIKPIIGLHLDYTYNEQTSSVLLYATNMFGYKNLMKLSSQAKISNKPVDFDFLSKCSMGLILVVPTFENIIGKYLKNQLYKEAYNHLALLQTSFTNIYLGVTMLTKEDKEMFVQTYNFAQNKNIDVVDVTPISFLNIDDSDVYQTLLSIASGGSLVNLTDRQFQEYMHSQEDMELFYSKYPEVLENTTKIANKCLVELEFSGYQLPKYSNEIDASLYLKELCYKGLKKRLIQNNVQNINVYEQRLLYELETIKQMGFSDYFLIVWDYVKFAKKSGIYVGPGRGSAAASLVSYTLGITDMDPIYYGLLFERFLNKERITMPDIDIDFPDDARDKVIEYVGKKYGENKVAHIATFGTFKIKLAIRDTARVLKTNENSLKQVLKVIDKTNKNSLSEIVDSSDELLRLMNDYEDIDKLLTIATKIEGLPRNTSTHAAGIVMTSYDLVNYTALDNGLDGIYQTQFEASDLEDLGLLKMDFLGLKNLTNISKTIELIKLDNPDFIMPKEENDPQVFKMLATGDVVGVFQLESAGMSQVIMDLKTSSLDDIISALALYRPGPMDIIPTFVKRKFGLEQITYPHEDVYEILKETYGTIVYQEQIMQIAVKFAGYSLGRADILRRAVSKKKKEVLEQERISFVSSSVNKGYSKEVAEKIYDYIVKFADYGFNKAHSVAYAKLSYQTAYLKCYYPTYYMSTLMTTFIGSSNDIQAYYKEALKKNIGVLGPRINESLNYFISVDNKILFPLTIIKGLGEVKVKEIIEERLKGKFTSFKDFLVRTKDIIPFSLMNNIIYSGALDEFKLTKKAMIESAKLQLDLMDYADIPGMKQVTYTDEEYPYGTLLEKEKEVIGLNIKYNFFRQYAHIYKSKNLMYIKDIKENMQVRTLGILSSMRIIKTKKDEDMAFAVLEDNMSSIELTLFPNVFNRYQDLRTGVIVIITGTVQMRSKLQIVVNDIQII